MHLPGGSFAISDARRLMGRPRLVGVSTHEPAEVAAAAQAGADFAVYGPVYAPLSKAAAGVERGAEGLGDRAPRGGWDARVRAGRYHCRARARARRGGGAQRRRPGGVAVIGAVFGADDPAEATRELLRALAVW